MGHLEKQVEQTFGQKVIHSGFRIPAHASSLRTEHSEMSIGGGKGHLIPADLSSCLHLGAEPTTSGKHFSTGLFPGERTTWLNPGQEENRAHYSAMCSQAHILNV